jgi:16S rRNA (guanine527-N7)-methyltransferase
LKIVYPFIKLTLLEATAKKTLFLRHVKHRLGLDDVEVVVGRAEDIAHKSRHREKYDIVLGRGVAALAALVELTLPFCSVGGTFIAQKKEPLEAEINQATKAIKVMGGKLREVKNIELSEFPDERRLVAIDKLARTPEQYPRRPGVPGKKPL